jgi:trimeric autotransporter adhesin
MKRTLQIIMAASLLLMFNHLSSTASAQGTAFTYQGQLQNTNGPVHGTYNFSFNLFNTNINGTAIAGSVTVSGVVITNGLFTVALDFGSSVWNGQTNWLQIAVETNGASSFTNLSPRQQLTPTPYAIFANTASNVLGTVLTEQLSGTVSLAQLPGAVVTNNEASVTLSNVTLTGTLNLPSPASIESAGSSLLRYDNANNFYAGPGAGSLTNSGSANTAIGSATLQDNVNGTNNTAIGYLALGNNTNGSYNTATGERALNDNTSGNDNSAYGRHALEGNTVGSDNTANGYEALQANTGSDNTADGSQALNANISGTGNTADGYQALLYNTSGYYNTANGVQALFNNTIGSENTASGVQALGGNTSGYYNTANGAQALFNNTIGSDNTASGVQALGGNTSGYENTASGYEALNVNTIGSYNTASGVGALFDSTSGSKNTAIGMQALSGLGAGTGAGGSNNIALGYEAGTSLDNNESGNIDIGNGGVSGDNNVTRIGTPGTQTATYLAGNVGLNGALNIDNSGTYGQNPGTVLSNAMTFGTGPGGSGEGIASKRVGTNPFDLEFYTGFINRMVILSSGDVGIGTTNPDALLSVNGTADKPGGGSWNTFSDGRLKDVGEDFTHGLEALDAIQPVHYHYKLGNPLNLPSQPDYIGVVAQQVQSAIPEAVHRNQDGYLVVNNDPIIWTMFNAIKELDQKRETEDKAKDAEIQDLKQQNNSLAERLSELEAAVKQLAAQK